MVSVGVKKSIHHEPHLLKPEFRLTYSMDIFSRADAAGITADSPAFQQGTEGPWLIL